METLWKTTTDSVKSGERLRRTEGTKAVKTSITQVDQPLSPTSELANFWACTENKIYLQQFFIKWVGQMYEEDTVLYLGGCHKNEEKNECYMVPHNDKQKIRLLFCTREEADDRIQFGISHAVTFDSIEMAFWYVLGSLQALCITTNST